MVHQHQEKSLSQTAVIKSSVHHMYYKNSTEILAVTWKCYISNKK